MNQELQIVSSQGNGSSVLLPLPQARVAIAIRLAVLSDVPFMDRLQRMHTKMVGFFPTAQFEGNIKQGKVLIAEEVAGGGLSEHATLNTQHSTLNIEMGSGQLPAPVGYCVASDRYFKHDDVGIIYQMNVLPGKQRGLIGASLLKAQFERSAYGCKLYCCWCAQDIAANKFWEAMGFVALAFRTGGRGTKSSGARTHIFWQKRIRSGDVTTPWWFPSETTGGAIKENRVVLPIPPGTHWSDAKPLVLPGMEAGEDGVKKLPAPRVKKVKKIQGPVIAPTAIQAGGLRFGAAVVASATELAKLEAKPEKKVRQKNDPKLVAAARELRDRWLEQVNGDPAAFLPHGKYDVSRALAEPAVEVVETIHALPGPSAEVVEVSRAA